MTRSTIMVLGVLLATLAAAPARAADPTGPYVTFSGFLVSPVDSDFTNPAFPGVTFDIEGDTGLGVAVAAGTRLNPMIRVEVEASYRQFDLESLCATICVDIDGDVRSLAAFGNVVLDVDTNTVVRPYLGGGVGLARIAAESDDLGADDTDNVLAYQILAGAGWTLSPTVTLITGYRYFATEDPTIEATDISFATHNVEVGVRIGF